MNTGSRIRKQFIEVPLPLSYSYLSKLWIRLKGIFLSPFYLVMAQFAGGPGIGFHLWCVRIAASLFITGRISLKTCYNYLFLPMDSTRYFEFHEVWKRVKGFSFTRYLDVSSPRLIPLLLLRAAPAATAEIINPDSSDLKETEEFAQALGVKFRCMFTSDVLENVKLPSASFDLITSISVLEHIPDDKAALKTIWALLRTGGKLILTLPCLSQALEQYVSYNQYGLLHPGEDGYTFWQHYYDRSRLESCVFSVTGTPVYVAIFGEKSRGLFFRNASMKRLLGAHYPFWREPYMIATEYQPFSSTDDLPGEGVIMLEFIKTGGGK